MEIVRNTNRLIHESSPYLLQHAHNPVDWYPWGEEAFNKAKQENKMVLVSIGYSSCHWCHVMEKESFEDGKIAAIMNENFVCIKVDREERPDVDHIYMDAVQILTGSGGWPLNCFALPDGRPVYGGTYFPKKTWENVLLRLKNLYQSDPAQVIKQAEQIYEGISLTGIPDSFADERSDFKKITENFYTKIKHGFDPEEGGFKGAPKFPTPVILNMLLDYSVYSGDTSASDHVYKTLDKMALGGIYDQLGGGFARYSVDSHWIVPHFEKMLYDNAQLVSVYCKAWQSSGNRLYKQVIEDTLSYVIRDLTHSQGGFYSSYDADSDGREGKFYIWSEKEIEELLNEDARFFCDLYQVTTVGNWEDTNILHMKVSDFEKLSEKDMAKLHRLKEILFIEREKRQKPALDDKIICSWNALMIDAFIDAYHALDDDKYLDFAESQTRFILNNMISDEVHLQRIFKEGKGKIPGFLDDYAFFIRSLIRLYVSTFNEEYLNKAKKLTDHVTDKFLDKTDGLFFYTSSDLQGNPVRKKELQDSVLPSSNSIMAENLFFLARYFESESYRDILVSMCKKLTESMRRFPRYFSKWIDVLLWLTQKPVEIVITGEKAGEYRRDLKPYLKPHFVVAGSVLKSDLFLMMNRFETGKTKIFICSDRMCSLPVENVNDAIDQLQSLAEDHVKDL